MKQFKLFAVALAALTMFSCQKENTDAPEGETGTKTVQISIANADVQTRGEQEPGGDKSRTPINGSLLVYCFSGEKDASVFLHQGAATVLDGKYTITKVPSSTKFFYIIANVAVGDIFTPVRNVTSLSKFKANVLKVKSYQDITQAPMANATTDIQTIIKPEGGNWTVAITVAPLSARVEVVGVEGDALATETADQITRFDLVGIHMNNYYTQYSLGGKGVNITFVENVTDGTKLRETQVESWSYDHYNTAKTGSLTYSADKAATADVTELWGYMLAPATDVATMPRIILEVNNLIVDGDELVGSRFVTVKGFKDARNSDAPITTLDRNKIYNIKNIKFNGSHLTIDPNQEDISVDATVTIESWNQVDTNPDL